MAVSQGWGVLHLFWRVRSAGGAGDAIARFAAADDQQAVTFSVLGGRADAGLMALSPDLDALDRLAKDLHGRGLEPVSSFISLTELSEYTATEDDERARLEAEGEDDVEGKLAAWNARIAGYRQNRLYPTLPDKRLIAFYPMSKTREPGANWYSLPFDERKALMLGHGRVGRKYAGRIIQLITGATGLDDWEWGVTLFADDPVAIKDIVYEMRFDPVSAEYGVFGPFWTGLLLPPDEVFARAGA